MKWNTIVVILLILTLPFLIILTSARFLIFNENYYHQLFVKYSVYQTMPDANNVLHNITMYFRGQEKLNVALFTENEKSHMKDVKILINQVLILYYVLIIGDGLLLLYLYRNKKRYIPIVSILSGTVIILFSGIIYLLQNSFSTLFITFHLLFFPQGNWMFPESSRLIQLFPEQFFSNFFYDLVRNACIASIILILFGYMYFVLTQEKNR